MPLSYGKNSREARALRSAAAEWGRAVLRNPTDSKDSEFAKADSNLRRAALDYARAVRALQGKE